MSKYEKAKATIPITMSNRCDPLLSHIIPGARFTTAPKLLTLEMQRTICEWLRHGNRRTVAARLSGISTQTFENWFASGEVNPDSVCGEFRKAVLAAEDEHEASLVKRWTKINEDKDDYRGVEALLKHRHKWQTPGERLEITGANGGAIQVGRADLEALSVEELEQYQEIMLKMAEGRALEPARQNLIASGEAESE